MIVRVLHLFMSLTKHDYWSLTGHFIGEKIYDINGKVSLNGKGDMVAVGSPTNDGLGNNYGEVVVRKKIQIFSLFNESDVSIIQSNDEGNT